MKRIGNFSDALARWMGSAAGWVSFAVTAAALRLIWLSDMQYKADQMSLIRSIREAGSLPWNPFTPISDHAGIAHSPGLIYLVHWLSFGSSDPVAYVGIIAGISVLSIVVPLILLRQADVRLRIPFVVAAVSPALFVYSRDIWTPALLSAWVLFCIGFYWAAQEMKQSVWKRLLFFLSGFCLVMTGHMYLPGVLVALVVLGVFFTYWVSDRKRWRGLLDWGVGAAVGWITFLPYVVGHLMRDPRAFGSGGQLKSYAQVKLLPIFSNLLTLPSSFRLYFAYVRTHWFEDQGSGMEIAAYALCSLFLLLGAVLILICFYRALTLLYTQRRRVLKNDPLLVAAIITMISNAVALVFLGLGSPFHYWLAVIPLSFVVLAFGFDQNKRLLGGALVLHFLFCVSFLGLVHHLEGYPGEYGDSYRKVELKKSE